MSSIRSLWLREVYVLCWLCQLLFYPTDKHLSPICYEKRLRLWEDLEIQGGISFKKEFKNESSALN